MKDGVFALGLFLFAFLIVTSASFFNSFSLTGNVVMQDSAILSWDNPCTSDGTQYRLLKTGFAGFWKDGITENSVEDDIESVQSYQLIASCFNGGNRAPFVIVSGWVKVQPGEEVKLYEAEVFGVIENEEPICVPSCIGKDCGGDGCGGNCGICTSGEVCSAGGLCLDLFQEGYFDSRCEVCGEGFFNLCDKNECEFLGDCTYSFFSFSDKCS